jgi:hypothetical protein
MLTKKGKGYTGRKPRFFKSKVTAGIWNSRTQPTLSGNFSYIYSPHQQGCWQLNRDGQCDLTHCISIYTLFISGFSFCSIDGTSSIQVMYSVIILIFYFTDFTGFGC